MRFLVRVVPAKVPRRDALDSVRTVSKAFGVEPRNPKWTSYGALELDVFASTRGDFELFLIALSPMVDTEFIRDLNVPPPFRPESELLAEARGLFNAERYWECHEVLEGIWRTKQGEEKLLLQGIILVCAAFVHHQKGEDTVALGVLERASRQLGYPRREYGGFDLERLRKDVDESKAQGLSGFRV